MVSDDSKSHSLRGQFDILTILTWMTVLALYLSLLRESTNWIDEFSFQLIILFPASSCIPMLIRRLRQKDGHRFDGLDRTRVVLCVFVYSVLAIMLATIAFEPDWKGSKGGHWIFYTLDGWAGATLWPIFLFGTLALNHGMSPARESLVNSPWCFLHASLLAAISVGYVAAGFLLDFTMHSQTTLIVPFSVAICYGLLALIIVKNRQFQFSDIVRMGWPLWAWLGALATSLLAKIPLAWRLYEALPDEAPDNCFIVSAAAKGHHAFVGSSFDAQAGNWSNQQLETFRGFEAWLADRTPALHGHLRRIYNRVGPVLARRIRSPWVADVVYLLLKPFEWLAGAIVAMAWRGGSARPEA